MASLYAAGWRQGSILAADLPLCAVVLDSEGNATCERSNHGLWAVASQECELDLTPCDDGEPIIELRAVHTDDPPQDWGIRSSRLRLTDTEYVVSTDPRLSISAAALTALRTAGAQCRSPSASRSRAFAIWLGLRYDRPALPPELVPLAKAIADQVTRREGRVVAEGVRDVLMQFAETRDPIRYSLFAIIEDGAGEAPVREWLAGIAGRIDDELGIADEIEAATADRISFKLIETSYAADVTRLTWRPNDPEPTGA